MDDVGEDDGGRGPGVGVWATGVRRAAASQSPGRYVGAWQVVVAANGNAMLQCCCAGAALVCCCCCDEIGDDDRVGGRVTGDDATGVAWAGGGKKAWARAG